MSSVEGRQYTMNSGIRIASASESRFLTTKTLRSSCRDLVRALPPSECKVYTPTNLASAMIRAISPSPADLWLDPCVGPGAFISALHSFGVPKQRLIAVDIDTTPSSADKHGMTQR